ncbi:hypothetical protein [Flavobacterium sp.]|uniref:hypothetical protein n=1 Tax=Flavobacterium sp. TaxID=239 RepID=UPI0037BF6CE9
MKKNINIKNIIVYIAGIIICVFVYNNMNIGEKFQLEIDYINPLNDKIKIYYTTIPGKEIDGSNFIDLYTYGNPKLQKLIIDFPEKITPYLIRLDISENQQLDHLIIKNISLKYGEKKINGDNGIFMNYWSPNESLVLKNNQYEIIISPVTKKKSPLFISNIHLTEKIKKIKPFIFW